MKLLQSLAISAFIFGAGLAFSASALERLPSGVTVEHGVAGTGAHPKATDVVQVHYRGTLTNGTEFDSSYKRSAPATFPLNRVVPCWTQALQTMTVGETAKITCPAETAYGANSPSPLIPPNSVLVFEVKLLAIGQ